MQIREELRVQRKEELIRERESKIRTRRRQKKEKTIRIRKTYLELLQINKIKLKVMNYKVILRKYLFQM